MQYQRKLSGPIIDRIDLYTDVDNIQHDKLLKSNAASESSQSVQKRVRNARKRQQGRYESVGKTNAQMSNREIKKFANLETAAEELLNQAAEKLRNLRPRIHAPRQSSPHHCRSGRQRTHHPRPHQRSHPIPQTDLQPVEVNN